MLACDGKDTVVPSPSSFSVSLFHPILLEAAKAKGSGEGKWATLTATGMFGLLSLGRPYPGRFLFTSCSSWRKWRWPAAPSHPLPPGPPSPHRLSELPCFSVILSNGPGNWPSVRSASCGWGGFDSNRYHRICPLSTFHMDPFQSPMILFKSTFWYLETISRWKTFLPSGLTTPGRPERGRLGGWGC